MDGNGQTHDNPALTKVTFAQHNKRSEQESALEKVMTKKQRVAGLQEMRNGVNIAALGDKTYKAVEYESGFFLPGGLITGSTNRVQNKTSGNGKAVDFYSGLKLDGPLNKNSKNYEQVTRE